MAIVTRVDRADLVCEKPSMTIEIQLTKGHVALIDDEDAELALHSWYAHGMPAKGTVYARRSFPKNAEGKRPSILLHRAVMKASPSDPVVDHIDGNGLNCRRGNLRYVTGTENACNRSGPRADNTTSPYLGVWKNKHGRYLAKITFKGERHYLGSFSTAEEANEARLKAEVKLWGVMPRRAEHHS